MKKGLIVYVTGEPPAAWEKDMGSVSGGWLGEGVELVEVITRESGQFDIHGAWHKLVSLGMNHVVCKMAAFDERGQVVMTGRELRLCG